MARHYVISGPNGAMEKCIVRDIEITKTEIRDCTLYYVTLEACQVIDSKLYNCNTFNSTIKGSRLVDTQLHRTCFETSKLSRCIITTSPLAFGKFPTELRLMIFKYCLYFENRRSPALLVALRGDEKLYKEAIQLFYTLNPFPLDHNMLARCYTLSLAALSRISKLEVECSRGHFGLPPLPQSLVRHSRISEIHLSCALASISYLWVIKALVKLDGVQKITIQWSFLFPIPHEDWDGRATWLSGRLGVAAEMPTPRKWVWSAPAGGVLKFF